MSAPAADKVGDLTVALKAKPLPTKPTWLRVNVASPGVGVDRDANAINGVIVAEEGPFKSEDRGEFDGTALRLITQMMNEKPGGTKGRFTHPGLSSDGLGTFLGRYHDARMSTVLRDDQPVACVRADLRFDPTAEKTPQHGDLRSYIMDLAESDPDAFSTSLVLQKDEEMRLESDGTRMKDADGDYLPPLWRPTAIHALDIVDTGDATNSFLSPELLDGLPDAVVRRGAELLDKQFAGQPRGVIEARAIAFLGRYLDAKFGPSLATDQGGGKAEDEEDAEDKRENRDEGEDEDRLVVGDKVQWKHEDADGLCAHLTTGHVEEIRDDGGYLSIPDTGMKMRGTKDRPVARLRDAAPGGDASHWHLCPLSKLSKCAAAEKEEEMSPTVDPETEGLLLDIDMREREDK